MSQLIQQYDWAQTWLGPMSSWPQSLKITVRLMLGSAFPMLLFWGDELTCFYNDAYRPSLGSNGRHPAIGQPARTVWPDIWDFISPLIGRVMTSGEPSWFEDQLVPIYRNGQLEDVYWTFSYSPAYDDDGLIAGVLVVCTETTSAVQSRQQLQRSQLRWSNLIMESPVATAVYATRELIIDTVNEAMIRVWGKTPAVLGMKLADALPELDGQPFLDLLREVYDTGVPYQSSEQVAYLMVNGQLTASWFTFSYKPLLNDQQEVYAILNVAVDVTERVLANQHIRESRQQLLDSFEQAPVAIAMLDRTDLRFLMANTRYANLTGRQIDALIGVPMLEALPELADQGFDTLLYQVIETGVAYSAREVAATVMRHQHLDTIYVDLTYHPQRDTRTNEIIGVLVVAIDVTQQLMDRRAIEEAEEALRGAIEQAELATWRVDIRQNRLYCSERFGYWLGIDADTCPVERAFDQIVPATAREEARAALQEAIRPGGTGRYLNEHAIKNRKNGSERIIRSQAQVLYDEAGEPLLLSGTAQDVTDLRNTQLALERLVQERTEELMAANEELAALNEEYQATNEELEAANELYSRSNESLRHFAYVASHDLQEPLRKVQQFGDLLQHEYGDKLGNGLPYLERMQAAAGRMSALIKDLLSLSHLSTQQRPLGSVPLSDVFKTVMTDLELRIQETQTTIDIGPLPTVQGDRTQLEQLFLNLLSNAIKFQQVDATGTPIPPHIHIDCRTVAYADLPTTVRVARPAGAFYQLAVRDNGIGFDEKYLDRIFQVFQRLHNRAQYNGTGIGLAICERVATNHGGGITATSKPGQGATFTVYLPVQ